MSNEKIKQKAKKVNALLKKEYPIVKTPLHHKNAWELLIAVILSAQTLDETVNKVTPRLFKLYNSCYELAGANLAEVEEVIKGVNYYKTKAKNIIKTSQKLVENFDGKVPNKIEELTTLPGVGRKTANVIINEWFCRHDQKVLPQGFVVDTHVARVSKRLGFTKHSDPLKIEQDLMNLFDRSDWPDLSLRMIFHGRNRCKARQHLCCEHEDWSKLCLC